MTRISVLITNYNYEKFIEEAVESVLAQTVPVHEIILVDDGSTDSSREVIEGIARRHPDVLKPVFTENQGQAGALNTAFANCTGDVVFLLDSDDTWFPEKIATMLPHLDEAGFVQHNLDMDGEEYRSFLVQKDHLRYMQNFGYMDFFSPTSALGFRREVLEKIFPPALHGRTPHMRGCGHHPNGPVFQRTANRGRQARNIPAPWQQRLVLAAVPGKTAYDTALCHIE